MSLPGRMRLESGQEASPAIDTKILSIFDPETGLRVE